MNNSVVSKVDILPIPSAMSCFCEIMVFKRSYSICIQGVSKNRLYQLQDFKKFKGCMLISFQNFRFEGCMNFFSNP